MEMGFRELVHRVSEAAAVQFRGADLDETGSISGGPPIQSPTQLQPKLGPRVAARNTSKLRMMALRCHPDWGH